MQGGSARFGLVALVVLGLCGVSCGGSGNSPDATATDTDELDIPRVPDVPTGPDVRTKPDVPTVVDVPPAPDVPPEPVDHCASLGLPKVAMNTEGPFGVKRHDVANDFTFYPVEGDAYKLSDLWTGCDVYVFLTDARPNSALDPTTIWARDVDGLIAKSPKNVHYFFMATKSIANTMPALKAMQDRIDEALGQLKTVEADYWKERLHVAGGHPSSFGGWIKTIFGGAAHFYGFAIDRRQQIRLLGSFADVNRYQQALKDAEQWPWENNLSYGAHEVRQYNYEALRDAELAADKNVTIVSPWSGEVVKGTVEGTIDLPDAATMATFDTLQIDWAMDCPDPTQGEFGNCGAWDYLSHIFLQDEADAEKNIEIARFITTYHREGRYVVDATPMLAFMRNGGTRALRLDVSPSWNQQAYLSQIDFRFSNQNKPDTPAASHFLWSGGGFNAGYNSTFEPVVVDIPATAKRVALWAVITGHGMDTQNCAEFCNHQHYFTVNGNTHAKQHPETNNIEGCIDQIENGMVPNQGGTWWFGRGGWCPGQQVDPWVVDVTSDVTPGEPATVEYQAKLNGASPPDNAGNIRMVSYLVIYE
jgi:hypothetical protein